MTHEEYLACDGLALAAMVRKRDVSPVELLEIAVTRITAINPVVNAVVRRMPEEVERASGVAPSGPFSGVPFLAKDFVSEYEGHPTSAGSRLMADYPAPRDTEYVRRVRAAGLVVLGKTNLPEWGLVPYTEPELWGACHNPWDRSRTPGGSSGGSAAAVASGMVPLAGGGDGGGSLRIPASCCGLFGLKPTRGRTPTGPDQGQLWRGAVVEHVLTRSVRDSAAMLDATRGPDAGAPYEIPPPAGAYFDDVSRDPPALRVAWTTQPLLGGTVHDDCVAAVHDAVSLLEELGHRPVEAAPVVDGAAMSRAFLLMVASELAADLDDARSRIGRRAHRGDVEPTTWALALLGRALSAREYAGALRLLERAARAVGSFFEDFDVVLTPTVATPPPRIGALGPSYFDETLLGLIGLFGSGRLVRAAGLLDRAAADAFAFTPWTPIFNVTGQPAMSVPLWWNDAGLPIGVHFAGRFGDEATLFRLAGQLERARPWFDRLPALARGQHPTR